MTAAWGAFERLDRRLVVMRTLMTACFVAVAAVLVALGMSTAERPAERSIAILLIASGIVLLNLVIEYLRWRATRFRVTEERFELSFQLLVTRRRSLSRERIRTVDVTASPFHRLFGLATVVIGTGQQGASREADIKLDPVSTQRAEALRVALLRRDRGTPEPGAPEPAGGPGRALATLDWRWAAYAPLSFVTIAFGVAAVGAVVNAATWFGGTEGVFEYAVDTLVRAALVAAYLVLVGGAVLIGILGSLLLFTEMWWGYRLDREAGGTLRVRRGLLTTRSISIEERRLRGVELVEPLGIRLARGARVDAVATGIQQNQGGQRTDHKTLLPPAPKSTSNRVAAAVLDESGWPLEDALHAREPLTRHPKAALGRRLRWGLAPVLALAATLWIAALVLDGGRLAELAGTAGWVSLAVLGPIATALAADAYGNLGHGIRGGYLLARRGALRRSTVALQRTGVIGWTVRQSIFQRRAGLLTVTATTAAGAGAYEIPDVGESVGLAFAEDAVPDLLTPFIERDTAPTA